MFSQNRIELFYERKNKDVILFSRSAGVYIFTSDGKFVKSGNKTLNEWVIKNNVYVHDNLLSFSDGSFYSPSGGLLLIDEDLNILNNINSMMEYKQVQLLILLLIKMIMLIGTPDGFSKINFDIL